MINKILILILALFAIIVLLSSCEDPVPADYVENNYVEAYLLVDEPISGLKITKTLPVSQPYIRSEAHIRDAVVIIKTESKEFPLEFRETPEPGYYAIDQTYQVEPETKYYLEINLKNGNKITGETITPQRISWLREPKAELQYPKDSTKLKAHDSLDIEWTPAEGIDYYLLRVICHDTTEYGKYLNPPEEADKNRRCYNINTQFDEQYKNKTNWGFIGNTISPTVYAAFKWFGKHSVSVYAADKNMVLWFMNLNFNFSSETSDNYNSVKGGFGVFGSASVVHKEIFMLKNQK